MEMMDLSLRRIAYSLFSSRGLDGAAKATIVNGGKDVVIKFTGPGSYTAA